MWVSKMVESRKEAQSLRELLSYSKKKEEKDPLMEYLMNFRERMGQAKELLTDPELTAFFFVTLPEALPIAVITRFIHWFEDFGIPVGGVVVNMVIEEQDVPKGAPDFVRNRLKMQAEYMDEIEKVFNGSVRALVPLFEREIRGVEMLRRTAGHMCG
jgi:arsenite-transporting ATPase